MHPLSIFLPLLFLFSLPHSSPFPSSLTPLHPSLSSLTTHSMGNPLVPTSSHSNGPPWGSRSLFKIYTEKLGSDQNPPLSYIITEVILLCNLLFTLVHKAGTLVCTDPQRHLLPDYPQSIILQLPYCLCDKTMVFVGMHSFAGTGFAWLTDKRRADDLAIMRL